jgi:hypothetical protein
VQDKEAEGEQQHAFPGFTWEVGIVTEIIKNHSLRVGDTQALRGKTLAKP